MSTNAASTGRFGREIQRNRERAPTMVCGTFSQKRTASPTNYHQKLFHQALDLCARPAPQCWLPGPAAGRAGGGRGPFRSAPVRADVVQALHLALRVAEHHHLLAQHLPLVRLAGLHRGRGGCSTRGRSGAAATGVPSCGQEQAGRADSPGAAGAAYTAGAATGQPALSSGETSAAWLSVPLPAPPR